MIFSLLIYLYLGFDPISFLNLSLALSVGLFHASGIYLYFRAVKVEEISRVMPLYFLSHIFTAVMASLFLGEILSPVKYIGILLIVVGAVLINYRKKIELSSGFYLMLGCAFLLGVQAILTKYLLNFTGYWTVFSYARMGEFFALFPLIYLNRKSLLKLARKRKGTILGLVTFNESFALVGILVITVAISLGFVSLVNALSAVQPFFVLIFSLILSLKLPGILEEDISKKTVLFKIIATTLIFFGVLIITFY